MARRKNNATDTIEQLFEVSGYFWPVGLVISIIFATLTLLSFNYIQNLGSSENDSPILAGLKSLKNLMYLLPIILACITAIFSFKTYATFLKNK